MLDLAVRLEYYRQTLRRRLLGIFSIFSIPRTSGNSYHLVIIFLAILLAIPVVTLDLATAPSGLTALGGETDIFFAIICLGLTLIFMVVFAPLGMIIL